MFLTFLCSDGQCRSELGAVDRGGKRYEEEGKRTTKSKLYDAERVIEADKRSF